MRYEIYALSENSAFGLTSMGYSDDTSVTLFGPSRRNNYLIHYVLSGEGYFNGQKLGSGQGFLITPGMAEHYYANPENPWGYIWLIFDNISDINILFKEYNATPTTNIFEYNNIALLERTKNTIIKNNNKIIRPSELYEMFLHIFNNHNIPQKGKSSSEEMYYNYAIKFIELNLIRKITVDELLDVLGVSQPYLYSIFKKNTSLSPKQYIDMRKTEKAKELLQDTSMQITEVAASIGIDDCMTFSKYFKARTGMSPSVFRASIIPN